MRKALHAGYVLLCIAAAAALTWATYAALFDVTGSELIAGPAAGLFALMCLIAGIPRRRVPTYRKVLRLAWVLNTPKDRMPRFLRDVRGISLVRVEKLATRFGFFRTLALVAAFGILAGDVLALVVRNKVAATLPADKSALLDYDPSVATLVYAAGKPGPDGKPVRGPLVCEFTKQKRIKVPLERIPLHVRQAFIAAEDKAFYRHHGIDPEAIARAAIANQVSGSTKQGGSTLTQQAVKQLILRDSEKTMRRKIKEAVIAVEIERRLTKDKILEAYLNHVFLGRGAYGVEAAARVYFGKSVAGLTVSEAAILAGLPKAPSQDSPVAHPENARERQQYVLGRMVEDKYVSQAEAARAKAAPWLLVTRDDGLNYVAAPYFCDLARREIKRLYGNDAMFEQGLTIEATLDMDMQRAAEAAVRGGLLDLERRIGWNGPDDHDDAYAGCNADASEVAEGRIESGRIAAAGSGGFAVCVRGRLYPVHPDDSARMRDWEARSGGKLRTGDVITIAVRALPTATEKSRLSKTGRVLKRPEEIPGAVTRYAVTAQRVDGDGHPEAIQAALVAVEPASGELRAYVGGYDFGRNKFNIPIMARRQTGSSFKPYVYLTGLRGGMTAADKVVDRRVCLSTASGQWCPENYKGPDSGKQYLGEVFLDKALANSLNSISVQLLMRFGLDRLFQTTRDLGISSPIPRVYPVAIGVAELTLWEHTYGYAQIAANGARAPSHPATASPAQAEDAAASDDPEDIAVAPRVGVFFRRVTDRRGKVLLEIARTRPEEREQAVPSSDAYALLHLMKGVVEDGTGKRARELGRPIAAKTGTTNDFRDVWFMGCTADLCAGTWVGRMTPKPIVEEATGGAVALPIWLAFMEAGHPKTPPRDFPIPDDVLMMPAARNELVPFQRGRVREKLSSGAAFAGSPATP